MRIVFMGTPDFSVPSLEACIEYGEVVGVFTQPDRPKGRGKKLAPPPVKVIAEKHDIEVFQPEKLKTEESVAILKELNPDCIVVVAYGQILSKAILDIPKYGCINVHGSLLPAYRGAAPIHWAIVNGEKATGVTTMFMDVGLDTGDMILKEEVEITDVMTSGELHDILMIKGASLLKETLSRLEAGDAPRTAQDDALSSYASMLDKKTGIIDWSKTSDDIINLIRGMNPWPVAVTKYEGSNLKVFRAEKSDSEKDGKPGQILDVQKSGMLVKTGDGVINLVEIQFPNSKRMTIAQYILGNEIKIDSILD